MAMLRSAATRTVFRSLHASTAQAVRSNPQFRSQLSTVASNASRPSTAAKTFAPKTLSLVRWQASGTGKGGDRKMVDEINKAEETETQKEKLAANPELVSTTSSSRMVNTELGVEEQPKKDEDDHEMMSGVKADLVSLF